LKNVITSQPFMLFSDSRQTTSETSLNCQNNLYILNVNATQEEDKNLLSVWHLYASAWFRYAEV